MTDARGTGVPVVLIVDDEKPNLNAFARAFRRDFNVRTATSGDEALRLLAAERVDIVLTDFTMPEMSGTELLEMVACRWPDVGRVIVSGQAESHEIRRALAEGVADAILPKPWERDAVLAVVADVLGPSAAVAAAS